MDAILIAIVIGLVAAIAFMLIGARMATALMKSAATQAVETAYKEGFHMGHARGQAEAWAAANEIMRGPI